MENPLYFRPLHFQSYLLKYPVNAYYLDVLRRMGNLSDKMLEIRLSDAEKHLLKTISDDNIWKIKPREQELREGIEKMRQAMNLKKRQEVEDFFVIYFNQTLVMMCTVFDVFLVDCLRVITSNKPRVLIQLSDTNNISIENIINAGNYEKLFTSVQNKALMQFDFSGIEDKIKKLNKLGIENDQLFSLNDEYSKRYPDAFSFLKQIYKDRNDIIHREQTRITDYKSLDDVGAFMAHLIVKWGGIVFKKHFDIQSDIQLFFEGKINFDV